MPAVYVNAVTVGKVSTKPPQDPKIVYCSFKFKKGSDLFYSALQSLPQFCYETDADWGMVYDFMEAQCGELTDAQWQEVEKVYNPYLNDSRY